MTKTITRLYDNYETALEAVRALKQGGFSDQEISLVANAATGEASVADVGTRTRSSEIVGTGAGTRGAEIGGALGAGAGLLAGLGILAIPGIGPVVAAGWLASAAAGAVAGAVVGGGAGGIVDSLTSSGTPERDAHVYAEGVRRGGSLVTVRVADDREVDAMRILAQYRAVDMAERGEEYRRAGWRQFDESAAPYAPTVHDRAARLR